MRPQHASYVAPIERRPFDEDEDQEVVPTRADARPPARTYPNPFETPMESEVTIAPRLDLGEHYARPRASASSFVAPWTRSADEDDDGQDNGPDSVTACVVVSSAPSHPWADTTAARMPRPRLSSRVSIHDDEEVDPRLPFMDTEFPRPLDRNEEHPLDLDEVARDLFEDGDPHNAYDYVATSPALMQPAPPASDPLVDEFRPRIAQMQRLVSERQRARSLVDREEMAAMEPRTAPPLTARRTPDARPSAGIDKATLQWIGVALAGVAMLAVVTLAIVFLVLEDAPRRTAAPPTPVLVGRTVVEGSTTPVVIAGPLPPMTAAATAEPAIAAPKAPTTGSPRPTVVVAQPRVAAPVPSGKNSKYKSVDEILTELGEEQLRR